MQAFLTIFQWIILNRWIHKHLIWSCNLRDFNFKRYKQPFSGLYTSANSDLHMMTKRIPFLQQNFSSTLWNVYFLTFVVLNYKFIYSLIFHFIQVSCTGTTSLLKCKIHTIHFQISFPLLFWTIKNINPSRTTGICLYTCTTQGLTPRKPCQFITSWKHSHW